MNWIALLIVAAVVAVVFWLKQSGQVSARDAVAHLKDGALVIDVRSRGEFASGHLACAINVPLDEIETALPERAKAKGQVLLLHCASGMRSGVARQKLLALGFTRVYNLGAYGRAERLIRQANRLG
jgi:phage shock protein E